jgi:oligoendopeptidase F
MTRLNDAFSTIHRQIALYRFETELHADFRAKGYLSKEEIGELFKKHMDCGEAVEMSAGSENWWIYWSHIRYFFYVYSYASGLLISKALQRNVKQDPSYISRVKEFLSAGVSDSPKNIFAKLGIDITDRAFWDAGLQEIDDMLSETE